MRFLLWSLVALNGQAATVVESPLLGVQRTFARRLSSAAIDPEWSYCAKLLTRVLDVSAN
jgi:hypothetical protein